MGCEEEDEEVGMVVVTSILRISASALAFSWFSQAWILASSRLNLAAYLACSASSHAAARDASRFLRTSSSSTLAFSALAASASSSSLVAHAAMLGFPNCVPNARISCRVLACNSLPESGSLLELELVDCIPSLLHSCCLEVVVVLPPIAPAP